MKTNPKTIQRARRQKRIRAKIAGTAERPRLSVFKSNRFISAQVIDDANGVTLAAFSSQSLKGKKAAKYIEVEVAYENGKSKITGVKRLSTFSKRMYQGAHELRPVKNGQGLLVLSTPKGVLSGKEARKENVGGEALFQIW
jgi:small subunit ribosomal protein S8